MQVEEWTETGVNQSTEKCNKLCIVKYEQIRKRLLLLLLWNTLRDGVEWTNNAECRRTIWKTQDSGWKIELFELTTKHLRWLKRKIIAGANCKE